MSEPVNKNCRIFNIGEPTKVVMKYDAGEKQLEIARRLYPNAIIVKQVVAKNWKDLVGLKNDKYYLDIDTEWGKGWIRDIETGEGVVYLSTHTFYGLRCTRIAEKLLKNKGFDVKIDVNNMEGE